MYIERHHAMVYSIFWGPADSLFDLSQPVASNLQIAGRHRVKHKINMMRPVWQHDAPQRPLRIVDLNYPLRQGSNRPLLNTILELFRTPASPPN